MPSFCKPWPKLSVGPDTLSLLVEHSNFNDPAKLLALATVMIHCHHMILIAVSSYLYTILSLGQKPPCVRVHRTAGRRRRRADDPLHTWLHVRDACAAARRSSASLQVWYIYQLTPQSIVDGCLEEISKLYHYSRLHPSQCTMQLGYTACTAWSRTY